MKLLRKMSVGALNETKGGFKGITEETFMARIFGIARSVSVETSTFGAYFKFSGEFRGINQDGEESAAPVLYLIEPIDSMLKSALDGSEGKPVEFAFDIYAVPDTDPRSKTGYQYRAKTLQDSKPSEPLAALQASIANAPAIPPKKSAPQLALTGTEAQAPAETAQAKDAEEVAQAPAAEKAAGKGKK